MFKLLVRLLVVAVCLQSVYCITQPSTTLYVRYHKREVDGETFPSYQIVGSGPNWQDTGAGLYGVVFPGSGDYSIKVVNELEEQTILHAHGLLPPSTQDGVPYLSAVPIFPLRSQVYQYALNNQNGTYFLHSHFGFQLGNGLVVPLIISGNDPNYPLYTQLEQAYDSTILLEDLCPKATAAYLNKLDAALKDGTAIPRTDINRIGSPQLGDCSSWTTFLALAYAFNNSMDNNDESGRCPGVDPATSSDVVYTKFLLNGKTYNSPPVVFNETLFANPIRVRFINSGGMTNFLIKFPFSVNLIAMDGEYVIPYAGNSFWISVAQRLDFLVQVPQSFSEEYFTVIAYTESSESSIPTVIIYSKIAISESEASSIGVMIASEYFVSGMMNNQLDYVVQAFNPLPSGSPTKILNVDLTGDNGFRGINEHSFRIPPTAPLPYVPNQYPLLVSSGDRVQIVFQNYNPDGHPMHLHGHVFQIVNINGQPVNGPIRDVAFVPGGCNNVTIEFEANNPGIWALHCHLEFHSAAGMLTTVEYTE